MGGGVGPYNSAEKTSALKLAFKELALFVRDGWWLLREGQKLLTYPKNVWEEDKLSHHIYFHTSSVFSFLILLFLTD